MERALANQPRKGGKLHLFRKMLFYVRCRDPPLPASKAADYPMLPAGFTSMQTQNSMHHNGAERLKIILIS